MTGEIFEKWNRLHVDRSIILRRWRNNRNSEIKVKNQSDRFSYLWPWRECDNWSRLIWWQHLSHFRNLYIRPFSRIIGHTLHVVTWRKQNLTKWYLYRSTVNNCWVVRAFNKQQHLNNVKGATLQNFNLFSAVMVCSSIVARAMVRNAVKLRIGYVFTWEINRHIGTQSPCLYLPARELD